MQKLIQYFKDFLSYFIFGPTIYRPIQNSDEKERISSVTYVVRDLKSSKLRSIQQNFQQDNNQLQINIKKPKKNKSKYNLPLAQYSQQKIQKNQINQIHQEIVKQLIETDNNIRKLEYQLQKIIKFNQSQEMDQKFKKCQKLIKYNSSIMNLQTNINNQIKQQYKKQILNHRQFKYKKQLIDYPLLEINQFQNIIAAWKEQPRRDQERIARGVYGFDISYRDVKSAKWNSWLNDAVICNYIAMMNEKLKQSKSKYLIVDSLFTAATFNKNKSADQIQRAIVKKHIVKQHKLILPINQGNNHWFFVELNKQRINVYDSMMKRQSHYNNMNILREIMNFTEWFYQRRYYIQINKTFPQQNNHYDCGIMMTFGIKDVVRQKGDWSFEQKDCRFKRIQLVNELLKQQITGFKTVDQQVFQQSQQ